MSVATGPLTTDAFDSPVETVTADFVVKLEPGVYDLCVFGTDELGNVGGCGVVSSMYR